MFREVAEAWSAALEEGAGFTALRAALRARDVKRLKELWNALVPLWDERTFYDFVAFSTSFSALPFRHREVFGQVGFGTGGWDTRSAERRVGHGCVSYCMSRWSPSH